MREMRVRRTVLVVAALATAACGGGGSAGEPTGPDSNPAGTSPGGQPRPSNSVKVSNNQFTPSDLSVRVGTTVTWDWDSCTGGDGYGSAESCVSHNVTVGDGGVKAATQSSGTFARQFAAAGTYPYHCTIHGTAMSGRVVVQ